MEETHLSTTLSVDPTVDLSEILRRTGISGFCPDCADERILVAVEHDAVAVGDYCCSDCDAAVVVWDLSPPLLARTA